MHGVRRLLLVSLLLASSLTAQADAEAFLAGLRGVRSADTHFVRASAAALMSLASGMEVDGLLERHAADSSATVRLVVLEAAVLRAGLPAYAKALEQDDATCAEWAIARLLEAGRDGSVLLFRAAALPRARFSLQAADALGRLDGPAKRCLMAELLLGLPGTEEWRLLADLAGLPAGSTAAELLPPLYADKLLMSLAAERARAVGGELLPPTGLILREADLPALLAEQVPAHVPYILASAPEVGPSGRVLLARALAALHHPDAALHFADVFIGGSVELRTAAFAAALETGVSPGAQAVLAAVVSGEGALEFSALEAALAGTTVLAPEELRPVLAAIPEECAEDVLLLLRRHPDASAVRTILQEALTTESGFPAPHVAAGELVFVDRFSPLVAELMTHASWRVRCLAATGCRKLAREQALSVLEHAARDQVAAVRVAVAGALGSLANPHVRTLLVSLARDEEPLVREAAALGLAAQENWHIVPVLRQLFDDPDRSVANAAAIALLRHGIEDVRPRLVDDLKFVWLEARTLAALGRTSGRQ